jgi:Phage tail tube protein, GTA-gp10
MTRAANPARGEASLTVAAAAILLRPSFAALVAAEAELGPLFALVERAAEGRLTLAEMAALFFHCAEGRPEGCTRELIGQAIAEQGLARATPTLKALLTQILQGRV